MAVTDSDLVYTGAALSQVQLTSGGDQAPDAPPDGEAPEASPPLRGLVRTRHSIKDRLLARRQTRHQQRIKRRVLAAEKRWTNTSQDRDDSSRGPRTGVAGRPRHLPTLHGARFVGPTNQVAGLFPFVVGSGSPSRGVPLGPHQIHGETVAFSPLAWLQHGLTSNATAFMIGQPGIGKSAVAKRILVGEVARGSMPIVMGDVKPDYVGLVRALGGQVIRLGRGMDRLNPLSAGPIVKAAEILRLNGHNQEATRLLADARGRRLSLLVALAALGRGGAIHHGEELMLSAALSEFDSQQSWNPTLRQLTKQLREPTPTMMNRTEHRTPADWHHDAKDLIQTLRLMLEGTIAGIFDGPSTVGVDLRAPAIAIDISSMASVDDDKAVAAAMLAIWSYTFSVIDADLVLSEYELTPRRNYLAVLDELWQAIRGAPGLVDRADAITRVNRQRRLGVLMITHTLRDLEALPSPADRAKAMGFIDRASTVLIGAVPPQELDALANHIPGGLSESERRLIASWSSSTDWLGGSHPGRGAMMLKTGNRRGLPVQVILTADERVLYETTNLA